MQYFREHRGVNNYVDDVLEPLMDWSFEGKCLFGTQFYIIILMHITEYGSTPYVGLIPH